MENMKKAINYLISSSKNISRQLTPKRSIIFSQIFYQKLKNMPHKHLGQLIAY
jgi:hypothetical protein